MAPKAVTGGNVFLIDAPDGLVLVDIGVPKKADAILSAIQSIGKQPSELKHIILTHAHPDHIGSAAALVKAIGAETWMHPPGAPPILIQPGERIAQMLFVPVVRPRLRTVEAFSLASACDAGSFGSTGA